MAPLSRLGKQIEEVVAALNAIGAPFALIGGLALASHKVVRATQDVDLLTDADSADAVDRAVVGLRSLVNDPRRTQDLEDIRALLRANRGNLDLVEIREFFRLFQREALLEELLNERV